MRGTLRIALTVAALAAAIIIGIACVGKQLRTGSDFPIYYSAARTLLSGGSPYDVSSGLHGYVYLPFFALLLAPLAALPLPAAAAVWYGANVTFAAASIRAALRLAGEGMPGGMATWALVAALAPLLGLFHDNLVLGQANLFLLSLVIGGVSGLLGSRDRVWPGLLLGIAAALKMNAALLIVPVLIRGRLRPVAGFAVGLAAALLLPMLVLGPARGVELMGQWRAKVVTPAAEGTLQGSKIWDQSPAAGLRRLLVDAPAYDETRVNVVSLTQARFTMLSRAAGAAILVALIWVWIAGKGKERHDALLLDMCIACCGMLLVLGFNLKAQFVLLLLPAMAAASRAVSIPALGGRGVRAALLAAGGLLVLSNPGLAGRAVSNFALAYSSLALATLLLAGVLARMRLRSV